MQMKTNNYAFVVVCDICWKLTKLDARLGQNFSKFETAEDYSTI